MSEYTPVETVKHAIVVREGDDSKLNAIRIDEGKFKGLVYPVSYTHLTLPTIYSV